MTNIEKCEKLSVSVMTMLIKGKSFWVFVCIKRFRFEYSGCVSVCMYLRKCKKKMTLKSKQNEPLLRRLDEIATLAEKSTMLPREMSSRRKKATTKSG